MSDNPTVIEANQFVLRGASGKRLAMLTTNDDDEAYLCFMDHNDQPRMALGFTKDRESRLSMMDAEGNERVHISFLPNGQAAIMTNGGPGKPSVGIRGGWDEGCGIGAWSGAGKLRAHVGIDAEGMPNVNILNSDGRVEWHAVKSDGTVSRQSGLILPRTASLPKMPPPPPPPPSPND